MYEYQLTAADDAKRVIAKGKLNKPQLTLSAEVLRQIAASGNSEANRGVAQLKLKRSSDKKEMRAWLHYDEVRNHLRLVGQLN
jgi:hypothetical protein